MLPIRLKENTLFLSCGVCFFILFPVDEISEDMLTVKTSNVVNHGSKEAIIIATIATHPKYAVNAITVGS